MAERAQPSIIVTDHSTGYAEQLFGAASNAVGIVDAAEAAVPPSAFLPRSARTSLTNSLRFNDSPKANLFLPGAHRADSLELMLAGISPRFSIPKASDAAFSTGLDGAPSHSPYSLPAASSSDAPSASHPSIGMPSGRSVEGASTSTVQQDDMPRTFSGKVRKLKRHRIASASRLRQSNATAGQQAQHAQHRTQHAHQQQQQASPEEHLPQLHSSGGSLGQQHAQQAQHVQHTDLNLNCIPAQPPLYAPEDLLSIAQQHRLSPQGRHASSRHAVPALPAVQPVTSPSSQDPADQVMQHGAKTDLQHVQQDISTADGHHYQQQQEQGYRGKSDRHRPTAEAASLACFGRVVKAGEGGQGRMARSGPLQQPGRGPLQQPCASPSQRGGTDAEIASVPSLFEPYHVKPRGWGTGTLDRKMASLDRIFQKLPPGENRRRSWLEAVACSAPAMPGALPHQQSFVLTPGTAALPSELSLNSQLSPRQNAQGLPRPLRAQLEHSELSLNAQLSLGPDSPALRVHPQQSELSLKAQLSLSSELLSNPQHSWQAVQQPNLSQQPMSSQPSIHSQHSLSLKPLQSRSRPEATVASQSGSGRTNSHVQSAAGQQARQGLTPSPALFEFQLPGAAAQHEATAKLIQPVQHLQQQARLTAAQLDHKTQLHAAVPGFDGPPSAAVIETNTADRRQRPGQQQRVDKGRQVAKGPRTSVEDFSSMQSQLNQLEQQLHQMPDPAARGSRPQTAETKA